MGSRALRVIAALSLFLALLLAFDVVPFLRGGFGWQWPYNPAASGVLPLVLVVGLYGLGSWWLFTRKSRPALILAWAFLGACLIPLFVIQLRTSDVLYELFARTVSGVTTGPHMAGAEVDWASANWRDWIAVMHSFEGRSVHVALSPPGLPLWYGVLNGLFSAAPSLATSLQNALLPYQCHNWNLLNYTPAEWASAWFGILMTVWGACAVFPLHRIGKRFFGSAGINLVLWWPLVPALMLFVPTWNTFYPLVCLLAFDLLVSGLNAKFAVIRLIVSGMLVGLLTFANISLVPLLALFGFYVLLHCFWVEQKLISWANFLRPLRVGLFFGLGLMLPWLIYGLWSGLTPFMLVQAALDEHLSLDRPYLPWLWLHFWEWALFTGIPLILLWLASLWQDWRSIPSAKSALGIALFLTMLLLLLSGTARGETGRVWLYFSPFVLIAAYGAFNKLSHSHSCNWTLIIASQSALLLVLALTWNVIGAPDITPPPAVPATIQAERSSGAVFADSFQLANWDASVENNNIELRLNWQSRQPVNIPYWFSALLVDPQGNPVSEAVVWQPFETHYPTTCWLPGTQFGDTIQLPLPLDAAAGEWWISLSAFQYNTDVLDRLTVQLPDASVDTQVGLGPVTVP